MQRKLTALGFDTKGVDGRIGPNSRKAIRAWQAASGLTADGYMEQRLFKRLNDELFTLGALSCFLMAFIAFRLLRQESYYTQALRNIDASWIEAGLKGIQTDLPEGRFGSRKLVICALIGLGSYLLSDVYIF